MFQSSKTPGGWYNGRPVNDYINQRLKELYEKEMEQYKEELGEMGLAIAYVGNDE